MSFKASLIGIYEKKNINICFEYNTTNIQQIFTLRSVLQYLCKHIFVNFDDFIVINLFYIKIKKLFTTIYVDLILILSHAKYLRLEIRTTTVTMFNNRNILLAKKHLSLSRIPYSDLFH